MAVSLVRPTSPASNMPLQAVSAPISGSPSRDRLPLDSAPNVTSVIKLGMVLRKQSGKSTRTPRARPAIECDSMASATPAKPSLLPPIIPSRPRMVLLWFVPTLLSGNNGFSAVCFAAQYECTSHSTLNVALPRTAWQSLARTARLLLSCGKSYFCALPLYQPLVIAFSYSSAVGLKAIGWSTSSTYPYRRCCRHCYAAF